MNELEFSFAPAPWELALEKLHKGDSIPALRLLALTEGEDEAELEEAFALLDSRGVTLDVKDLPKNQSTGETARRERLEKQVLDSGMRWESLPETDPLRLYLQEVAATPAAGDPQLLAERYAAGEQAVAEMLVNVSLSQVIGIAGEMAGYGVLLLDLIQEGSLGLWQSILTYSTEVPFEAHSAWYIRQAMAKQVVLQARAGETGQKMRKLLESYRAADRKLLTQIGRNPTLEEISLEMGISAEDGQLVQQMILAAEVLENAKKASAPKEETPEDNMAVEDTAYFQSRQRIAELLSALDEQDAKLISLRFGLEGGLPLSPEDVGRQLGLTAQEVVDREAAALAQLRQ